MAPRLAIVLGIALIAVGCTDAVSVGDARESQSLGEDLALAQLAMDIQGVWYGTFPNPLDDTGAMSFAMTFTPYAGRRDGTFSATCTSDSCPIAKVSMALFGAPAPSEGTGQANKFATGAFELVAMVPNDAGEWTRAKCVFTPDSNGPAFALDLELSADGRALRFIMDDDSEPLDYTREPN